MLAYMPKKKKQAGSEEPKGLNYNVWLDPDLEKALESYFATLEFRPSKTRFTETAFKEFLKSRGFWPPKSK